MATQQTGSFGAGLGGVQALKSAMQRRGIDSSILDQVSGAAPSGPSPAPGIAPTNDIGLPQTQLAQPAKVPARSGEMEIAIQALAGVVKTENKIAESTLIPPKLPVLQ